MIFYKKNHEEIIVSFDIMTTCKTTLAVTKGQVGCHSRSHNEVFEQNGECYKREASNTYSTSKDSKQANLSFGPKTSKVEGEEVDLIRS